MPNIQIDQHLIRFLLFIPFFLVSITVHEYAHAFFAFRFGDNTAKNSGRLTLNPLKHIDLIGTIILPFISFSSGIGLIGWAKPIPVNRNAMRDPRKNDIVVSAAGPISNLLLAILFLIPFFIVQRVMGETQYWRGVIETISVYGVYFNIFLCLFNVLPIPPLDGSHLLYDFFPNNFTKRMLSMGLYGTILLLVCINSPIWNYFMSVINFVVGGLVRAISI